MKIDIYVQEKFYKTMDLGPDVVRYNYGNIASQISHEINQGLMENYDPLEHFSLAIKPINLS